MLNMDVKHPSKLYEVKPYGAVSHDLETDLHVLVQVVQDSIHIQDSVPLHLVVIGFTS
jgi:hypothetical protein